MKSVINTEHVPETIGPYSQGVILDEFIFNSGQLPFDPPSMSLVEGDIKEQIYQSLINLQTGKLP